MDTFGEEFQSLVKVPSVRYFNALLRIGGFKDREFEVMVSCLSSFGTASILYDYQCDYSILFQTEMRKLGLKTSPATIMAYFVNADDRVKLLIVEQIENTEELILQPSEDFFDFVAFETMAKAITVTATRVQKSKLRTGFLL